jgi:xanthine dehydrogenase YagS FAD-binding subunit
MQPFTYLAVDDPSQAIQTAQDPSTTFLAGGTNLIDEMKLNIQTPSRLVDIGALRLGEIETLPGGNIRIGAVVTNTDLAWNDAVRRQFPLLSEAILSGASPQLRNMATTGGNLLQHTRCHYFRDTHSACNMRKAGSGCAALEGYNRMHAVLGVSSKCIAAHPSDMCVALAALDAIVHTQSTAGKRAIPINEFYVPYGDDPAKLNVLSHGELITHVELPASPWATRSHYLKSRDRASYEFALASAAVALDLDGKTIRGARIALGGVATKPWRAYEAEKNLVGKPATPDSFKAAGEDALKGATPQKFNAFKIDLAKRVVLKALTDTAAMA